ncbi:pseudouridine synthase [Paludibacterium purpuratum]|uniref:tRNA pseudouridine32 synthase/23S rRNA pseudouridine746 synthase n=1 Tax=Paludibacterium purpuratum TaxID=1144873 RepID=A0A4R7BGV1_9NEIS|nr:pseudouridine synthase [Paludibacterium purpuratum]TDR82956.1 tRNA pseudouridine32 synthase/23S rRNA pseudouridine746 synthase [Paludibacterium purpuratum]
MSQSNAPVPIRHGLSPSQLHLPPGQWPSLLAFLLQRFPHVDALAWRQRLADGLVFDQQGRPFRLESAYPANQRIWYYREVATEVAVPFAAPVLYRDQRLVVADKPHLLACMPAGRHVQETLLTRLRTTLALPELSPIHRLDRETAGVILFCVRRDDRGAYQQLFQQHQVQKEYEAIAGFRPDLALPTVRRSRLQERRDTFLMTEVAGGEVNSETRIELIERRGALARYRLIPQTGKKHQLRAHLAAMGIAIHGDPWYPEMLPARPDDDFSSHLLLLARAISFVDPFDGSVRSYRSTRTLAWPES